MSRFLHDRDRLDVSNYKSAGSKRLPAVRYNELSSTTDSALNDIDPYDIAYTTEEDDTFTCDYPVYKEKQLHIESKTSKTWRVRNFIEGTELRMAENRCLRSTLTLLHVCIGLGAGFYSVYAAVGEGYTLQCLPPLVDHFGDAIPFRHGLPNVCHCIYYAMIAVSVLSFIMAAFINCLSEHSCVVFMNLSLTVVTAASAVFGGTVISVHYMVWCDSLSEATSTVRCADATRLYDDKHRVGNMTMYHTKLEMQQINLWALFPTALMAIVLYSSAMYLAGVNDTKGQSIRGYVVLQEETSPLIEPESTRRPPPSYGELGDLPPPDVAQFTYDTQRVSRPASAASAPYDGTASQFQDRANPFGNAD